jgi:hypothetical protein
MSTEEKVVFNNGLGTITDKRAIFNFKGGTEDVPIKQITSVSFERKQNIPLAIIYFAVCLIILFAIGNLHDVQGGVIVFGILGIVFFGLIGVAYYIGNYYIKISTAGQDMPPMKVEMAKTKDGREFTDALRRQIIAN